MKELLLQAAGNASLGALASWSRYVALTSLQEEEELWPLVFHNLCIRQKQKQFEGYAELRNAYAKVYAHNLCLIEAMRTPLVLLSRLNIECIIIKGAALLPVYYQDLGARKITDVDLLIREEDLMRAGRRLEEAGYKTFKCMPLKRFDPRFMHAIDYFDPNGNNLDLHTHLLDINCWQGADDPFFTRAVHFSFKGIPCKTLSVTDHFVHTCFHGSFVKAAKKNYWIIDAVRLLQTGQICWQKVQQIAKTSSLSLFLLPQLEEIGAHFGDLIPKEAVKHLKQIEVTTLDRKVHAYRYTQDLLVSRHRYYLYHAYRNSKEKKHLKCIYRYLQFISGATSIWRMPWYILVKLVRKGIKNLRG